MNSIIKKIGLQKLNILLDQRYKIVILTVFVMLILSDIVILRESNDIRLFGLLGVYVLNIHFYKLSSRNTFFFCLFLLAVMYVEFLFQGAADSTERAAVWLFFMLLIGIVQRIREH